jgi:hypothetical protein
MKDFDVHFQFNGYLRFTTETEDEARKQGNQYLHYLAKRLEREFTISVVDSDEESYVTDVLEVEE